jgi:transposase
MKQPRNWKQLTRHPLSEEYADITGERWSWLLESLDVNGFRPEHAIVLYEDMVLDGWQRQRACVERGIRPKYRALARGVDPERFVAMENDPRRHETEEQKNARVNARRKRVEAARREGQSIRSIAEAEGVAKSTIERDISSAGVPPGTPENENNAKISGRDGKNYAARRSRSLLCARCQRVGAVTNCAACAEVRRRRGIDANGRAPKKPKARPASREEIRDRVGNVVPDALRDVFADTGLAELIEEVNTAAEFVTAERWVDRATRLFDHHPFLLLSNTNPKSQGFKEHVFDALRSLQLAKEALESGAPYAVCPRWAKHEQGKACRACRSGGYVPEHRWNELKMSQEV